LIKWKKERFFAFIKIVEYIISFIKKKTKHFLRHIELFSATNILTKIQYERNCDFSFLPIICLFNWYNNNQHSVENASYSNLLRKYEGAWNKVVKRYIALYSRDEKTVLWSFSSSLKRRKAFGKHRGMFGRGRRQDKNDTYEQYESRAGLITQAGYFLVRAIFCRLIFIVPIHLIAFIPSLEWPEFHEFELPEIFWERSYYRYETGAMRDTRTVYTRVRMRKTK